VATADKLIELFSEAKAKPAGAVRENFVALACGDDPELRQQLFSLLQADAQDVDPDFLKHSPLLRLNRLVTEKPGDRIGRYKLLQQLGEGGCGVVYMAEQEEPVRRRVALKVIKVGMDTKSVIARFEAERQALALMDHPNIAKVFDAGATETGRPFFVMELVRGTKITEYCDRSNLTTEQRLELFTQVCHAVQHAHQKGIIHRDLKPSNILVTLHDGVPVPKVIDFGIAKATTDQWLTDKTIFTAFEQFVGTPAYISPEQAEMSGLDIDTRSDIYSLGVLLYELLTGRTPLDPEELVRSGMNEMRRKIREEEALRPSTRLSTMQAADLTTIAKQRQEDVPKLIHHLRGDLDWIVMKCLEKDRTRRYETANGLGADVRRHLQNEAVTARPPSRAYQFQKLIRRNTLAFAAGAAVAVALIIGAAASTMQAVRATRAEHEQGRLRQDAQAEAAKSQQVAAFLQDMLKGVGPSFAVGRDTAMLREILDETAKRLADLKQQPSVEADLRETLGNVYADLAEHRNAAAMHRQALMIRRRIFGNEHTKTASSLHNLGVALWNQGELKEAEALLRESLAVRRKIFGDEHAEVAKTLHQLGATLRFEGNIAQSETVQREALAIRRKVFGSNDVHVALSLNDLGSLLLFQNQTTEAEAMLVEALETRKKLFGIIHPTVAESINNLACVYRAQNKLPEAEAMHREALAMQRKLLGEKHPWTAFPLRDLGLTLWREKRLAEAESAIRSAVTLQEQLGDKEHPEAAVWRYDLARLMSEEGKIDEAVLFCRAEVESRKRFLGAQHPAVAESLHYLGMTLRAAGRYEEAEGVFRDGLAMRRKLFGSESLPVGNSLSLLGICLAHQHKLAEAEDRFRESLQIRGKLLGSEHTDVVRSVQRLVRLLLVEKKFAEAESLSRDCLVVCGKFHSEDWLRFYTEVLLGASLLGQQQYAEGESLLLSGCEGMKQREQEIPDEYKPGLVEALQGVVLFYEATAQAGKAVEWKARLHAAQAKDAPPVRSSQ
jgi:serine/threonine protein kinase/tetratricopeptide (TPR) repeat protein